MNDNFLENRVNFAFVHMDCLLGLVRMGFSLQIVLLSLASTIFSDQKIEVLTLLTCGLCAEVFSRGLAISSWPSFR